MLGNSVTRAALRPASRSSTRCAAAAPIRAVGTWIVVSAGERARAVKELAAEGIAVEALPLDLASPDPGEVAASPDILVNAAGVNLRQPFMEVTAAAFDLHMALHLRAPFLPTQRFAPAMAARGWGRILNIGSLQSFRAVPDSAPYGAGKGGITQLTRAIA